MQIEKLQTCTRMFEVDACSGIHLFGNVNLSESPQKNCARDVWENSFGMKIGCLRFGEVYFFDEHRCGKIPLVQIPEFPISEKRVQCH